MGIGGSIMDQSFMEEYLGLRVESVDEVEILRRMEKGIYDHEAYEKALAWTKEHLSLIHISSQKEEPRCWRASRTRSALRVYFRAKSAYGLSWHIRGS